MSTILVIEDDVLNLELFKQFIGMLGYHVLTATNAHEGIALAQAEQPVLILMDIRLPGAMDGIEATRRLKQDPATAYIPVIVATAHKEPGLEQRAFEAGCEGYFLKPIDMRALKEVIGSHVKS